MYCATLHTHTYSHSSTHTKRAKSITRKSNREVEDGIELSCNFIDEIFNRNELKCRSMCLATNCCFLRKMPGCELLDWSEMNGNEWMNESFFKLPTPTFDYKKALYYMNLSMQLERRCWRHFGKYCKSHSPEDHFDNGTIIDLSHINQSSWNLKKYRIIT